MSSILQRAAFATLLAASIGLAQAKDVKLTGDQEVPAVTSDAQGEAKIKVAADKTVTGKVTTKGMEGTMAHVHEAPAPGQNGPPIITLEKGTDGTWLIPAGSKLTDEQFASYKAGKLYVNVHSAAHKGGEIRAALKP